MLLDSFPFVSRFMCNLIKARWEKECYPHDSFSSARASLPSFLYPIYCLQPFTTTCSQPCRNVVFHRQGFELANVVLMGEGRDERGRRVNGSVYGVVVDSLSCIKVFRWDIAQ